MIPFLNKKRLLAYPFLLLISLWTVSIINLIFSKDWYGLFGGFISYDFLAFFTGAKLYWTNTANLYKESVLANLQHQVVGIPLSGLNFYTYPPNAAFIHGLFSLLPYTAGFIAWTIVSITCLVLTAWLIHRYLVPKDLIEKGVSLPYIIALIFSFYPVIFGLQNGQNHAHTLLIMTLITIFTTRQKPYLAGFCAALLLYKPQMLIGWLILWLLLRYYKAVFSFALSGTLLVGISILVRGFSVYLDYLRYIPQVATIFIYGHVWAVTPVAIIDRIIINYASTTNLSVISLVMLVLMIIGMVIIIRRNPSPPHTLPMILALLFPFLNFHALFYELVLLVPMFALWSQLSRSRMLLLTAMFVYISALILPIISELINFPLMGFIPIALLVIIYMDLKPISRQLNGTQLVSE
jgi:hypothetical protein